MHAEPVERGRPDLGDMTVKNLVRVFGELEAFELAAIRRIEDADVDPRRMCGEDREIRPGGVGGRAERVRLSV